MTYQTHQTIQQAIRYFHDGNFGGAANILAMILHQQPKNVDALHILGVIRGIGGRHAEAKDLLMKAIKLDPNNPQLYFNLAKSISELGEDFEAIPYHERAIQLTQDRPEFFLNYGKSLAKLCKHKDAIEAFKKAIEIKPDYAEAFNNRGNAQWSLRHYQAAIESYEKAIEIKPDYAEAFNNRGNALVFIGAIDLAIQNFCRAIEIKPNYIDAFNNLGNTYGILKKYDKAIESFKEALYFDSDELYIAGTLLHTKMKICDWDDYDLNVNDLTSSIISGAKSAHPFFVMTICDDLKVLKKSAEIWVADRCPEMPAACSVPNNNQKIKIGYFSSDYRFHPVSLLTAELYELHDRNKFEVIAFSFGPNTNDALRKRLEIGFDKFLDVQSNTDEEIVSLARSIGIDIAVDLGGHTQDSRTSIFSSRVAPIQLSYIGFLGTMGASYMDYIIADHVLVPDECRAGYQENIIYLPSYQANDRKKSISDKIVTREHFKIPNDCFVYCSFNNNFKITPQRFKSWMRILKAVKNSVLLIYAENELAKINMSSFAKQEGVEPTRLFFVNKLPLDEYLAQYKIADLFLDTFPYNAGTTASDALWAGLPILTMQGNSFASRMASSLLIAIGLPELITCNEEEYISRAIELAKNPEQILDIKSKILSNREHSLLFNTEKFTKKLEEAYFKIYDLKKKNLDLCDIVIN